MTNLLQDAATWMAGQLKAAGGRVVQYRRLGTVISITATPQQQMRLVTGDDGLVTDVAVDSWTVTAADLTLGEPRPGDQIVETLSLEEIRYEVLPLATAPCFEWFDSSGIMLTVHTKRVGA